MNALLKYAYSIFYLNIFKYYTWDKILARNQYNIDLLKSKYNICKTANLILVFKQSKMTKVNSSIYNTDTNLPFFYTCKSIVKIW